MNEEKKEILEEEKATQITPVPEETPDVTKGEIAKFRALFGDISPDHIPEDVWEEVKEGQSLCAVYALHLYEKAAEASKIRDINDKNKKTAPGRITTGGGEEYFSPEAVKAMDDKAVRKHYAKIIRSMEHWN